MRRYAVVTAVLLAVAASAGILIAKLPISIPRPEAPSPPTLPTPLARPHAYKQIFGSEILAIDTGARVSVGVWIDNNATKYTPGDTLTIVIGMKPSRSGPMTVIASETAPLVSVRIIVHAPVKTIDSRYEELSSVDLLAQQLSQTGVGGWAIAWEPSEKQLRPLRRPVTLPDPRYPKRDFLPEGFVEVARVEIPHDEVEWGWELLGRSTVYLEVNGSRHQLRRKAPGYE